MVVDGVVSFLFSVGLIESILALKLLQHIWGYNRLHQSTDTVIASSFIAKQSKQHQKKSTLYVDCFADASSLAMTTQFLWHTPLIKQDRHCEQFYREAIQAVSKKSTLYGLLR